MDKRAATIAGLSAAVISLLLGMGSLQFLHDNAMGLPRLLATIAVSYTHLDVYKRQYESTPSLNGRRGALLLFGFNAVSAATSPVTNV